jgi:superfamily II DNA or RNA helicase
MRVVLGSWAWIDKSELSWSQLARIRDDLTVWPRKVGDFPGDDPEPIYLFVETPDKIGVAREYFLNNRSRSHDIQLAMTDGTRQVDFDLEFAGTLREEQAMAVHEILTLFSNGTYGGVLRASPGWGKTVFACALVAQLRIPTLVVVHKEFLADQWHQRIAEFLPDARIGRVQGDTLDFAGKHVVIGMVHTLAAHDLPKNFIEWPGFVITDELHRIGAPTWSVVPPKFPARLRLGLTATPRRKDGADNVFWYHIGPILFDASEQRMQPKVRRVYTDFRVVKTARFNPALAPRTLLIRFLVASKPRNKAIAEQVALALKADRKILVLSERLKHLDLLAQAIRDACLDADMRPPTFGKYVGGKKRDELATAAKAQVVLATSQYAKEGLDIPALDTLFLVTPMSDVEQAVGRILRPSPGKKDPIVVDFRDDHVPMFRKMADYREATYVKLCR